VADPTRTPGLPFWIHQVVEYLLGLLMLTQAIQTDRPLIPVLLGVAIIVLAATADGPVAAFHLVPRRLHRALDIVVLAVVVVVAVVFRDELGTSGLVFAVLAAAGLAGLVVRTDYRTRPRRITATSAPDASPSPEAGPEAAVSPGAPASKAERVSRAAGRALGRGIKSYREPPPS
jgi:hypothetical protein